ncbi:hypothetical protein ACQCN2_16815 [Brevibacillus ginsengisoli]|uniref:hypothetical protein n=1 Tax=Brevibacillus ginsengisoli TaxID=363854 RepID=UPI003CF4050B
MTRVEVNLPSDCRDVHHQFPNKQLLERALTIMLHATMNAYARKEHNAPLSNSQNRKP